MYNVHTCIGAAPRMLPPYSAPYSTSSSSCNLDSATPSMPPPSAAQGPEQLDRHPQIPTSHFPVMLVPHPQMSKPSQHTKDCRLVGRSGNRENRPRTHTQVPPPPHQVIQARRAQRQTWSYLCVPAQIRSGEERFSLSGVT
jgi:hypothetical protein